MQKGMSLHIGLNRVDPRHYDGWDGQLQACINDALDMSSIARQQNIESLMILDQDATRDAVMFALGDAAKKLQPGDYFLLTYSGHGGQLPDGNGDEADGQDETWCLYDGQLIDDELYLALNQFAAGVRILVLSDSCHSGTVVRDMPPLGARLRQRRMSADLARRVYAANRAHYEACQHAVACVAPKEILRDTIGASVVLISGCQDHQTSMDGPVNGAFTGELLKIWNGGAFRGGHGIFHREIKKRMPKTQVPNLVKMGNYAALSRQKPFTV
jgi:metacaspase-1